MRQKLGDLGRYIARGMQGAGLNVKSYLVKYTQVKPLVWTNEI